MCVHLVGRGRGHMHCTSVAALLPAVQSRPLCPSCSLAQFPNYLTVVEEPDGKDYPSYHLIDWFWRSAIITPMAADATLLLCGAGRLQGGHTGRWLDISRIIFAYAGDENLETVEASTRTAIGDVVPDRLSKTLAHAARQALNDGSPAWLPAT